MSIHATAIIDPSVQLADDVFVGPYAVIGPDVCLGPGCRVEAHALIACNTTMGPGNVVHSFASIGGDHQSAYHDDAPTHLIVGEGNAFHEYCTVNRGSYKEEGVTRIGDRNIFMAYSHVAHDCHVEDDTIMVNHATIGGHVRLRHRARVGAFCAVHQFCDVGELSFLTRGCLVTKDVLPCVIVQNNPPSVAGLNKVGLQRQGVDEAHMKELSEAYRIIFRRGLPIETVIEQLESLREHQPEWLSCMIRTLKSSERGIER